MHLISNFCLNASMAIIDPEAKQNAQFVRSKEGNTAMKLWSSAEVSIMLFIAAQRPDLSLKSLTSDQ